MTDEIDWRHKLGPAIAGYVDPPKPPRKMKQPTKDELREQIDRLTQELVIAERKRAHAYGLFRTMQGFSGIGFLFSQKFWRQVRLTRKTP